MTCERQCAASADSFVCPRTLSVREPDMSNASRTIQYHVGIIPSAATRAAVYPWRDFPDAIGGGHVVESLQAVACGSETGDCGPHALRSPCLVEHPLKRPSLPGPDRSPPSSDRSGQRQPAPGRGAVAGVFQSGIIVAEPSVRWLSRLLNGRNDRSSGDCQLMTCRSSHSTSSR
jgi:hypothetical protein